MGVLRDYQTYAVKKAFDAIQIPDCSSIVAAPTGVGKSHMIAALIKMIYETWPNYPTKVLSLVHVKELIEQNVSKLKEHYPEATIGIYSSGLGKKDLHFPITFAGIASIFRMAQEIGPIDIVIVDECHLIGTKNGSMYVSFLRALKILNPNLRLIGFTATPYRVGLGLLTEGELFNDICCDMTTLEAFNWFIDEGYLCPLVPVPADNEFDDEGIKVVSGDYSVKDQDAKLNQKDKNNAVVDEIIRRGKDRHSWLVFGVSVSHVEHLHELFVQKGISSTFVHSKMKDDERDQRLLDYKAGKYKVMINNGILTTGFDHPALDLIAVVRLIRSPGLWVQILGRGTRPLYLHGIDLSTKSGRLEAIGNSEKRDCLVIDFGGNTMRLGCINDVVMPKKKGKGSGGAPVRLCECGIMIHASLTECPHCGQQYARDPVSKLDNKASTHELIAKKKREPIKEPDPIIVKINVDTIVYNVHSGRGAKPDSLRAVYNAGLSQYSCYLCFDHPEQSMAWLKARRWWRQHVANTPYADLEVPKSVAEALSRTDEISIPKSIEVDIASKFKNIVQFDFNSKVLNT